MLNSFPPGDSNVEAIQFFENNLKKKIMMECEDK